MQLQLPMVVGKKVTEVEKEEKKEVETMKLRWEQSRSYCSYIMYFWPRQILFPKSKMLSRWDQRGEAELRMEEGTLASKEQRQVNLFIKILQPSEIEFFFETYYRSIIVVRCWKVSWLIMWVVWGSVEKPRSFFPCSPPPHCADTSDLSLLS